MESSLPTIWKLPSQEKALFPLLSPIPTENLPSHLKSGKLPSHWKAAFPLRRSLLNIKLLFYWEPNFPHWESSFILGSSLPVPTGNLFPSHLEALFPLESSLPIRKLHYHWEAPTRKSLVSGKLPCHWKSEKPSSHWEALFPLGSSLGLPTRKLPFQEGAPFPLGRSLLTVKFPVYWEPYFPLGKWETSFLLGSSLPTVNLFPVGGFLPTEKLHSY